MAEQKFEVYYIGLKQGVTESIAVESLAQLLSVKDEAAKKIIRKTHSILSSGLSEEKAQQYLRAFNKIGLEVALRECSIQRDGIPDSDPDADPTEVQHHAYSSPASAAQSHTPIEFKGQGFEYFKIWIVNLFLTIITLSIYSAWAKVRNKQYFYGNTFIQGSSFRYTAKPIAILKGRLIALGFFLLYSLINNFNPILGFVLFIILMTFFPWIIVRSLQFNARNSMFRNIRFNFNAKATEAATVFLLWPILVPFTLGLILPYIWYKQSQFFINHSSFGTSQFAFSASAKDYYKIFLNILLALLGVGVIFALLLSVFDVNEMLALKEQFSFILVPLIMLVYLLIFAYSAAALGNLYFNATTIQAHGFSTRLKTSQMAWLYVSNTIGIVLTLGLFIPWAQIRIARYRCESLTLEMNGTLDDFVDEEQQQVSALGEQMGEVFDMDVSIL